MVAVTDRIPEADSTTVLDRSADADGDTDAEAEHEGKAPTPKPMQPPMYAPPHVHGEAAMAPTGQNEPMGQMVPFADIPLLGQKYPKSQGVHSAAAELLL